MSERVNLGAEIATARKLLDRAQANGFVGAGDVALRAIEQTLDRLLAIDAVTPLRFTVEQADSQARLIGEWWDAPEAPLGGGRRGPDGFPNVRDQLDRTPEDPT